MKPDEVRALYDHYADRYNALWHESYKWQQEQQHQLDSLTPLVEGCRRWLDVGCGTGWLLSRFPGVERAGVDLTPGMLAKAREANPDAVALVEHDVRNPKPEWHGQWDLITSTGFPWSYFETMDETEVFVENLASWSAPDATVFIAIHDITDFTGCDPYFPYPGQPAPPLEIPYVTGIFWSMLDAGGVHRHLVAPSIGLWAELLCRHFTTVEVKRWPQHDDLGPVPRRYVVATGRRVDGDTSPATFIDHPVASNGAPSAGPHEQPEETSASTEDAGVAAPSPDPAPVAAAAPTPTTPPRLLDLPVSHLVKRFRPWEVAFWRSAARHVRRRR